MEKNNLNALNEILFDTLRGVQEGKIDDKKAQTITNVGNSIIQNAKIQLSAYKLVNGKPAPASFGLPSKLKGGDRHAQKFDFANEAGYPNVADAINKMGKMDFNNAFEKWLEDGLIDHGLKAV